MTWLLAEPGVRAAFAAYDARSAEWRLEPLVVTARFGAAVVCGRLEDLSLDGVLAAAALETVLRDRYYELPSPQAGEPLFHLRLPLALQGPGAEIAAGVASGEPVSAAGAETPWWWACTTPTVVGANMARQTQYWHKRFDLRPELADEFLAPPQNGRVRINGGRYKSQRRPVQALSVWALRWAGVGDAAAIQELLAAIPAVGKHRAQGYGTIRAWQVEPAEHDESLWTSASRLARPVPVQAFPALGIPATGDAAAWLEPPALEWVGYRAPRWEPRFQALCASGGRLAR